MTDLPLRPRLSAMEAAWVIARRDFVAVLFSRAFLFFLLGPLFPVIVGGLAGSIGGEVQREAVSIEVGLAMSPADNAKMIAAGKSLAPQLHSAVPLLRPVPEAAGDSDFDARAFMEARRGGYAAIVTGTLQAPTLVGTEGQIARWQGPVGLLAGQALAAEPARFPKVAAEPVATSAASEKSSRIQTAQIAQMLLFLLTMLLAGMVLSNLVEEKGNKIIEILAAAVPIDAIFLGKLFAMLGMAMIGIACWTSLALVAILLAANGLPPLPMPAIGWPAFLALGVAYFAMAYLLLGSAFLVVGAQASTPREIQMLALPISVLQMGMLALALAGTARPDSWVATAAQLFPLSSPFAMAGRAATSPALWPHLAAIAWQLLWVTLFITLGARLFRRGVLQSGSAKPFWKRGRA